MDIKDTVLCSREDEKTEEKKASPLTHRSLCSNLGYGTGTRFPTECREGSLTPSIGVFQTQKIFPELAETEMTRWPHAVSFVSGTNERQILPPIFINVS